MSATKPMQLAFLHIPKTAGTSFRTELERHYGRRAVFPGKAYLKRFGGKYPPYDRLTEVLATVDKPPRVVVGHYSYGEFSRLAPNARVLTFLREPIERAISFLWHVQRHHPDCQGKRLEDIAGISEGRPHPGIDNLQTRLLRMNKDKGNRLDEALSNLPNLAFIGLVEQYIDSVNLFNEQFGTRIGCRRVLNRGTQSRANVSEALREFVAMHNREDAVLYTAAENLFAARTRDLRDCYG